MPVFEQHRLELEPVGDRIVAVVVVHGDVHALGLAVQRAGGARNLLELLLAVQVVVLLGDRRRRALKLREETLEVSAVEAEHRGRRRQRRQGRHARATPRSVDRDVREVVCGQEAERLIGACAEPRAIAELDRDDAVR
jgi:hypothetical protein